MGDALRPSDCNFGIRLEPEMGQLRDGEGEEAGGYVVEHDAGAFGESFELADGRRFEDVEGAEENQGDRGMLPVGGDRDQGDELAGDLVDDDMAGIFAARFARDDGGGGDADQCGDDGGYCCADSEWERSRVKNVSRREPEEHGGDAAVGAGAGLEQASTKEGADEPGPERLLF